MLRVSSKHINQPCFIVVISFMFFCMLSYYYPVPIVVITSG